MALTRTEYKELAGLHDVIAHAECFSTRDLLREQVLYSKASDTQLLKICVAHYQTEL